MSWQERWWDSESTFCANMWAVCAVCGCFLTWESCLSKSLLGFTLLLLTKSQASEGVHCFGDNLCIHKESLIGILKPSTVLDSRLLSFGLLRVLPKGFHPDNVWEILVYYLLLFFLTSHWGLYKSEASIARWLSDTSVLIHPKICCFLYLLLRP